MQNFIIRDEPFDIWGGAGGFSKKKICWPPKWKNKKFVVGPDGKKKICCHSPHEKKMFADSAELREMGV